MTSEVLLNRLVKISTATVDDATKLELDNLITSIKQDICTKSMRSKGSTKIYSAAKRILKSAKKMSEFSNIKLGAKIIYGNQYICDSYRIVKFFEPMELEELDDDSSNSLFLDTIEKSRTYDMEIKLPSIQELKAAVKIHKAEYTGKPKIMLLVLGF